MSGANPPRTDSSKQRSSWFAEAWRLARDTVSDWLDDDAPALAAALSYYTLLSVAPLMILAIAVAGLAFGEEAARGQIAREVASVVGVEAGRAIESIVANAKRPAAGIVSSVVGVVILLIGASGAFVQLQSSLDAIWRVKPKPGRGLLGMIKDRFFSVTMVLSVAFLMLASLLISAGLSAAGQLFESSLPGGAVLWQVANFAISLVVTTGLFALIFKVVPDAEIEFRDVAVGSLVTAALFTLGKALLALYIGKSGATSAFGAAGSMVAFVLWVYYSSQVLFLGAEFTRVYVCRFGKQIQPSAKAVSRDAPASEAHAS